MENVMLFLSSIGESWSTSGQFFGMLNYLAASPEAISGPPVSGGFGATWGVAWSMIRFFGATLFVALLAWYVTKRMASSRGGVRGATGNLSVVESIGVGGQAVVRLVRAGDKHFVIGVTKERVTLLGEVDSESVIPLPDASPDFSATPFGKILSRYIQPQDGTAEPKDEAKDD